MLTKTKPIRNKSKNIFVLARAYGPGQATTTFERNLCNMFRENRCHRWTGDGRRTDERRGTNFDFMSSGDILVKQS